MVADALAPYVTRTSAAMILTHYIEYVGPYLIWGKILSTCVISMWSNDIKCKRMFIFPLKNLARKELTNHWLPPYMICRKESLLPLVFLSILLFLCGASPGGGFPCCSRWQCATRSGQYDDCFLLFYKICHLNMKWCVPWVESIVITWLLVQLLKLISLMATEKGKEKT